MVDIEPISSKNFSKFEKLITFPFKQNSSQFLKEDTVINSESDCILCFLSNSNE